MPKSKEIKTEIVSDAYMPVQRNLLEEAVEDATKIVADSVAENTRKAYRKDLDYWQAWAMNALAIDFKEGDALAVPVVVKFITDHRKGMDVQVDKALVDGGVKAKLGTHSIATVERRVATISKYHQLRKLPNPCKDSEVKQLLSSMKKIAVKDGERPRQKNALTLDPLEALLATCGSDSLVDIRDRALLLFAFSSGGRRRSEVAAALVSDLRASGKNYTYTLPCSKTDQSGHDGLTVPIVDDAAVALRKWLDTAQINSGHIFRGIPKNSDKPKVAGLSEGSVNYIVKQRCKAAGLDPRMFSSHSLRSGYITESGRQGVPLPDSMAMSGHKTPSVAIGYHRTGDCLNNPGARLMAKSKRAGK